MSETALLATLEAYAQQLDAQLAALRERRQDVETAWTRVREVYEGEGAQVFGEAFEGAFKGLADYGSQGAAVARQLELKIEQLRTFQATDPGL